MKAHEHSSRHTYLLFLWHISGHERLPAAARERILDAQTSVFLSTASVWECLIKAQLGKLTLPAPPTTYLCEQRRRHGIASLSIDEASLTQMESLPLLHRDPFDRVLIAQAIAHRMQLYTVDKAIAAYDCPEIVRL